MEIQAAFLIAFNSILGKREEIIEAYHEVMEALTDTTDLDTEREQLQNERIRAACKASVFFTPLQFILHKVEYLWLNNGRVAEIYWPLRAV